MIFSKINLGIGNAELHIYKPDRAKNYPAMLVIPGGGYAQVCTDREGEPIALAYASKGYVAAVLHYSIAPTLPENSPLAEASKAMAYIRRNADALGVDKTKVYAVGFSAGGHLCGSLGTLWHREDIMAKAAVAYGENRPTAVVLCYPVISAENIGKVPHLGSFYNLLGKTELTKEEIDEWSLEKHVDEKSAPAFIIHTAEDEIVPVQNSLVMANAYANAGIQFELHVYPHGPHGNALGTGVTDDNGDGAWVDAQYARWVDDSIYFFEHLK